MPAAQYDYFAHYEDLWDARSMTSTPSTVEIPLAELDLPSDGDEGEEVSPFDNVYEVPEPVLVLQDVPHEERDEIAAERRERFVEAGCASYTLVRLSSRRSETRCDSAANTLVDDDDASPDTSETPFADTAFLSTTTISEKDEDEDDVSLTDTARLGHLHLTTKDSYVGLRRHFTPQQERKVGRVVKTVLGSMVKGLGRVKSI
ncbi:hypothetical protein M409DRAFT_56621 [Zasmidium cellare ATCC 36951]|uniref:Uncharacterized protein n=1 Tax=Zasmidium cellare ATCC 36951 TaxID=1080233 RepID=A0A6A6CBC1_ZASCE|nr:uncharacterized protein M409DRAFT_56621 [Zasmidium cellare ATCC 36951]KAF2164345.1 hypothetical protein M409DRAFT_56621 [Zasmidium cellare ATCC 36951]